MLQEQSTTGSSNVHDILLLLSEPRTGRIALLGDTQSGKTTLLNECARRCSVHREQQYRKNAGGYFVWASFQTNDQVGVASASALPTLLQMFDPSSRIPGLTADRAKRDPTPECIALLQETLEQADLVVILCDASIPRTSEQLSRHIQTWSDIIQVYCVKKHKAGLLVMTKSDLYDAMPRESVMRICNRYRMNLCYVSPQRPQDIDVFLLMVARIINTLHAYQRNLLLVNRPLCPPECKETTRVHRHLYSEDKADPLGRIEYARDKQSEDEYDQLPEQCTGPSICMYYEHQQPDSMIRPQDLRVGLNPVPVPSMTMQHQTVQHTFEDNEASWVSSEPSWDHSTAHEREKLVHNKKTKETTGEFHERDSLLVTWPPAPSTSLFGWFWRQMFGCRTGTT